MKLLVIGDTCTDVFVYGSCDRICPEAPVPVFQPENKVTNLGMSGNVVSNVMALDCDCDLIVSCGNIIKTRYIDEKTNQMIIRLDENDASLPPSSPTVTLTLTPIATPTPTLTFTPLPTLTATATLAPPFVLQDQDLICDLALADHPQIQVLVVNEVGDGISGVEIIMQWVEQEEHFFTGLKPELGIGYADFDVIPQIIYTLHIAGGGQVISGLSAPECSDLSGQRYWGSWRLSFTHP